MLFFRVCNGCKAWKGTKCKKIWAEASITLQNELNEVPIKQARILSRLAVYLFGRSLKDLVTGYVLSNKITVLCCLKKSWLAELSNNCSILIDWNIRRLLWVNACVTRVLKCFFLIFILEYRKNYSGPKNTNEAREAWLIHSIFNVISKQLLYFCVLKVVKRNFALMLCIITVIIAFSNELWISLLWICFHIIFSIFIPVHSYHLKDNNGFIKTILDSFFPLFLYCLKLCGGCLCSSIFFLHYTLNFLPILNMFSCILLQ